MRNFSSGFSYTGFLIRAKCVYFKDEKTHISNCAEAEVLSQDIAVLNTASGSMNAKDLPLDELFEPHLNDECEESDRHQKPFINTHQIWMNTTSQYEKLGDRSEEHYYKSLTKDNKARNHIKNVNEITRENNVTVQGECGLSDQRYSDVTQTEDSDDG